MSYNESLKPNSNYPLMSQSEWDNAPFNQKETPEREFDVTCSQTLSKTVKVSTDDYILKRTNEYDDVVGWFMEEEIDTFNTSWIHAYAENEHYTPLQLINILKNYINKDLISGDSKYSKQHLEHLLEECNNWIEDETEIVEE